MSSLSSSLLETQRARARKRLPSAIFHYVDGGADDEWTLGANTKAFDAYQLVPRILTDVGTPETKSRLFGDEIQMPLVLAPAAGLQLLHPRKEVAVAAAAARARIPIVCAMLGNTPMARLARENRQCVAQLYLHRDEGLNDAFIDICQDARVSALCVTVDAFVPGNRERDRATGMTMPMRLTARNACEFATRLPWVWGQVSAGRFLYPNIDRGDLPPASVAGYIKSALNPSPSWADLERVRDRWNGPLAIKGLLSPLDARRAVEAGVTTIFISNHGGRQLDGAVPALSQVEAIRQAVGPDVSLVVDGGVRRGTDILKAVALGANACSIGRPYLFALAAGGEMAIDELLTGLRDEIARGLALLGCRDLAALTKSHLKTKHEPAPASTSHLALQGG